MIDNGQKNSKGALNFCSSTLFRGFYLRHPTSPKSGSLLLRKVTLSYTLVTTDATLIFVKNKSVQYGLSVQPRFSIISQLD